MQRGKYISQAQGSVLGVSRRAQGEVRAVHGNQDGNTAGDHRGDGGELAAQMDDVSQQLSIERAHPNHHTTADGATFVVLRCSSTMRPLAIRATRSAIAAIALLCVMTAVVVCSS